MLPLKRLHCRDWKRNVIEVDDEGMLTRRHADGYRDVTGAASFPALISPASGRHRSLGEVALEISRSPASVTPGHVTLDRQPSGP